MGQETLTLIKGDISKEARKIAKPLVLDRRNTTFQVTYRMDKALVDKLDTDARFVSKLYDDITADYEELVNFFAMKWLQADQLARILPLSAEEEKEFEDDIEAAFKKYEKRIKDKAEDHVDKWLEVRKDRTKYQRSVATNVVTGSFSLVTGAVSAAASGVSGGATFVMAIISIGKGIVKLIREYKRVSADVDKAKAQVDKTVKELESSYQDSKHWQVGLKEAGKSAVADFLVYEMTSIKRADKEFVTYKGKVAPLHEHTAELGRSLNELLDKQSALDRKLEKEVERLFADRKRSDRKLVEFRKALDGSRASVMDLITQLKAMNVVLEEHEEFTEGLRKSLAALHDGKPGWATLVAGLVTITSLATNPSINAILTHGESLQKQLDLLEKGWDALKDAVDA